MVAQTQTIKTGPQQTSGGISEDGHSGHSGHSGTASVGKNSAG